MHNRFWWTELFLSLYTFKHTYSALCVCLAVTVCVHFQRFGFGKEMDLLDDQLNELDNMLDDGEDDWMHIEHPMAIHWRDIGLIIKIAWSWHESCDWFEWIQSDSHNE